MILIPSYSQIADLIKKGATLEAQERIMELREAALGLQEQNVQLTTELRAAKDTNDELKEQLKLGSSISFKDNVCWVAGDTQPICPLCWEDRGKVLHLTGPENNGGSIWYDCKFHDQSFFTRTVQSRLNRTY